MDEMTQADEPVSDDGQMLSPRQAYVAAYRFIAGYYDYERTAPILRVLQAISWTGDHPESNQEAWPMWKACVQETRDAAPLPELPPPWA
jgi:hypothetical protein